LLEDKNIPNSYFYNLRLLSFASFKPTIAPPSRCCAFVDKIFLACLERVSSIATAAIISGAVVIPASKKEGGWMRCFGGQ